MQQERKIPSLVPWTGGDKASNADFILRRSRHHNPLNPLNLLNLLNPGTRKPGAAQRPLFPEIPLRQVPGEAEGFLEKPQVQGLLGMNEPVGLCHRFQGL